MFIGFLEISLSGVLGFPNSFSLGFEVLDLQINGILLEEEKIS